MHLAQVKLLLRQADKRDAVRHLQTMQDMHTAVAPLMVGDDGKQVMDARRSELSDVITGTKPVKQKDKAFAAIRAAAGIKDERK